jgi:hypothetical protein
MYPDNMTQSQDGPLCTRRATSFFNGKAILTEAAGYAVVVGFGMRLFSLYMSFIYEYVFVLDHLLPFAACPAAVP